MRIGSTALLIKDFKISKTSTLVNEFFGRICLEPFVMVGIELLMLTGLRNLL